MRFVARLDHSCCGLCVDANTLAEALCLPGSGHQQQRFETGRDFESPLQTSG